MSTNFFYQKLGYEQLTDCSDIAHSYPEYQELGEIGANKVYFSGDFPAVIFKEVHSFDANTLREIAEIQHKVWNYRKVIFLFALSDTEIKIYNCYEKPKYIAPNADVDFELKSYEVFGTEKSDVDNLKILVELFSQVGVDCGLIWTNNYEDIRNKVNVQQRIDRFLVQSLVKTADFLSKNTEIGNKEIVHSLLMRSLFILYLEDKGAAKEAGLYEKIKPGAGNFFDILDDVDATYHLFDELHKHFNGNVFPLIKDEQQHITREHLKTVKNCFTDGDISGNPKLFEDWRLFKFDFIQIELLSEVYENFLGELADKKEKGQFYTPYSLVELILNDELPVKKETNFNVKTLDPACGSGIFLVESYKRLIKRWKNANPKKAIRFNKLCDILTDNIFGIEIDPLAIKVTAFSLYLALMEQLNPKTLWIEEKKYKLPYLINNPNDKSLENKQGKNLWCRDTIGEIDANDFEKVDLVVGNPPFGTKKLSKSIMDYCAKYDFGKEMVLPFLHKSVDFCPKGNIALVFNAKVLTNTEKPFQNFRRWLLNDNYVEKVYNLSIFRKVPKNFGGQLFTSAVGPICIAYFQKDKPSIISDTIEYWAPKTYVKSNIIDGVLIDSTDIKYLPRFECQQTDTKIWKIAMWGNIADFRFIEYLTNKYPSLKDNFRRLGYIDGYKAPHILLNEGVQKNQLTASFLDYDCSYFKGIVGIISNNSDTKFLKYLCSFLNSSFVKYFAFMTTSSWGIERDVVKHKELFQIPFIIKDLSEQKTERLINLIDAIIQNHSNTVLSDNTKIEEEINRIILENLSKKNRILIEDSLQQIDLFQKGAKSKLLQASTNDENQAYANMICEELNDFYQHVPFKVSAAIYDVQLNDPLNLIVLHFADNAKSVEIKDTKELIPLLKELNKYSIQEKGKNIYVQKQFRYYDNDKIYLIKPNQKRFWTRSQAVDDAMSLIVEIANMGGTK
ncbi:type I endonuclease-methyltransferase fusion protein [Bacteroidia bacterium]|nr:type I endonuclease-methyltransferase fusion protein [Bacteroidia bacterium]